MAAFCERDHVLDLIGYKTEIYYDAQKDKVGDSLYSDEIEDVLPMSNSLDAHQKFIMAANLLKLKQAEQAKEDNEPVAAKETAKNTKPKMTVNTFAEQSTSGKYTHRKIDLKAAGRFGKQVAEPSALSAAIKELPSNMMQLKVFFPADYGPPITVRVPNVCSTELVIRAALKKYLEANRSPPLSEDLNQYEMRMAEADGTPDEDMPKLGLKAPINQRLGTMFALCINPGDVGPSQVKTKMIRIALPNNQKTTIPYQSTSRTGDIVRKLCQKRGWNAADYHLRIGDEGPPLPLGTMLAELADVGAELKLCTTTVLGSDSQDSSPAGWDFGGVQYTSYNVKMSKLFGATDMVLGIDEDRITLAKKKGGGRSKDQRLIGDLVKVSQSDRTKATFTLEWADGKQERLEADSAQAAKEIIAKLEMLKSRGQPH
eukprot:TRINITY_DN8812_c0_g1_i1.p1 TRINITY_DN8812_c0_g1~~TRINITY_DN8812_c0_g1_i1.p1  ORF type:complete len:450 (+),score=97.76 TRINITY_DN8812_c0_g1_i1:67-1350(+)